MAAAAALALAMALPASAGQGPQRPLEVRAPDRAGPPTDRSTVFTYADLWNQFDNQSSYMVSSVASPPDSIGLAADDFTVPPGSTWAIGEVEILGADNWGDPATFRVAFYEDAGGLPGTPVAVIDAATATKSGSGVAQYSFDLVYPVFLGPGTYWLSVGGNMSGGTWLWVERTAQNGYRSAYYNGSLWGDSGVTHPDLVFAIGGTAIANEKRCTISGTDGDDGIAGTSGTDYICGKPGKDQLVGRGGNDTVNGGLRMDHLDGNEGDDLLLGRNGPDVLSDQLGNDTMKGGAGADILDALDGSGGDVLIGGPGIDHCGGDPGDTFIGCETIVP
jgi:Ca2+-binding RTX toxin-like protein